MQKINLLVSNENLETLLTILDNLKDGLIQHVDVEGRTTTKNTQYKPKQGVIYEKESGTNDISGKYSATAYRARLKK